MTSSTPRALLWPFEAPMSARRQASVLALSTSEIGPVEQRTVMLWGSSAAKSIGTGNGGGAITGAMRGMSWAFAPVWKSAPSGAASSSGTERLQ